MKSDLIISVFKDEYERNTRIIARYEKEVQELPKGSIFKRKIGNQEYIYLNYREGKKVVSKFVGNVSSIDFSDLENKVLRRKELTKLLKKLYKEQKELEKELK